MIITNKKIFDKVCRVMTDFCKKKTLNERPFDNRITVSKNFFIATDEKIWSLEIVQIVLIMRMILVFP